MQDTLVKIGMALAEISNDTYHYAAPSDASSPYIVWQEDGIVPLHASDGLAEYAWTGTVDIYSSAEFDPLFDAVKDTLEGMGAWELLSVSYEMDTGLIHYEYSFEVPNG